MFPEISGNPDTLAYCDVCDSSEMSSLEHRYLPIYRVSSYYGVDSGPATRDLCINCLKEFYAVDDLVLAFYPEIADFINQDADMAATARSVELPFDELQSVVVIRQYADYSKIPAQDVLPQKNEGSGIKIPRVRVVTIQGRLTDGETVDFEIHVGYAPLAAKAKPVWDRDRPQVHMAGAKWINLENYQKNTGVEATFRYNLFDQSGFVLLCEWAASQSRQWLCHQHLAVKQGLVDLTKI